MSEDTSLRPDAAEQDSASTPPTPTTKSSSGVNRRDFVKLSAIATAGVSVIGAVAPPKALAGGSNVPDDLNEATLVQLQSMMASGRLSASELLGYYLQRIQALDQSGPTLNSVIELNPDAAAIAASLDQERRHGHVRGPLHGIPILLKDNIDTGDRMQTAAGSLALVGRPALQDSTIAANLRKAGAVIMGKTTLSEWANFRSFMSTSGWSGRGGQCNNPYLIDRNPSGSSSGSAAATSANLTAVSLGSETDGSIVSPGNASGVAAIKPTIGLTSRAGVVPISHTQDTVGPHGRTIADCAAVLGAIQSRTFDGRDPATGGVPLGWQGRFTRPTTIPTDYTQFLDPNGLSGRTIGYTRQGIDTAEPRTYAIFQQALAAMQSAGATIVDLDAAGFVFPPGDGEFEVLCFDFVGDARNYFATRVGVPVAGGTLATAQAFNNAHAAQEMPFFAQEIFDLCVSMAPGPNDPQPAFGGVTYNQALANDQAAAVNGIDLALSTFGLDAIVCPTGTPAWCTDLVYADRFIFGSSNLAAIGGYPIVQIPMGQILGLPVGISFFGTAFSEPMLIKLASGYEAVSKARIVPQFQDNLPTSGKGAEPIPGPGGGHHSHFRPHHM